MRYLSALILAAVLCLPVVAQKKAVPLVIDGETVLVVKSVPFKVIAPPGADDYTWTYPNSVEAQPLDNVLTVSKCPAGEFIVVVRTIKIDFDQKKVIKENGAITVVFGKGPDPGPGPDTPLAKALKDAFSQETATDKATLARKLGAVYAEGAKAAQMGSAKTVGQLFKAMEAGAVAGGVVGKLPRLSMVIAGHCKALPSKSSTAIDDSNRDLIVRTLSEIAVALGGLQ